MLTCLFWLVLKAAPVNKKHRYVLCYVLKEKKLGKKISIEMLGRGEGGGGAKSQKRKGSWGSRCLQRERICALVLEPRAGEQQRSSEQSSVLPVLSPWPWLGARWGDCWFTMFFFPGDLPVACPWVCAPPYADFCSIPSVSYLRALMHMFWRWPPWLWVAADGKPSGCHRLYWC